MGQEQIVVANICWTDTNTNTNWKNKLKYKYKYKLKYRCEHVTGTNCCCKHLFQPLFSPTYLCICHLSDCFTCKVSVSTFFHPSTCFQHESQLVYLICVVVYLCICVFVKCQWVCADIFSLKYIFPRGVSTSWKTNLSLSPRGKSMKRVFKARWKIRAELFLQNKLWSHTWGVKSGGRWIS